MKRRPVLCAVAALLAAFALALAPAHAQKTKAQLQRPNGNSNTTGVDIGHVLNTDTSLPLAGSPITLSFYAQACAGHSASGSAEPAPIRGQCAD